MMIRLWKDGKYLMKVRVLMKTIAANYDSAMKPKMTS